MLTDSRIITLEAREGVSRYSFKFIIILVYQGLKSIEVRLRFSIR